MLKDIQVHLIDKTDGSTKRDRANSIDLNKEVLKYDPNDEGTVYNESQMLQIPNLAPNQTVNLLFSKTYKFPISFLGNNNFLELLV